MEKIRIVTKESDRSAYCDTCQTWFNPETETCKCAGGFSGNPV